MRKILSLFVVCMIICQYAWGIIVIRRTGVAELTTVIDVGTDGAVTDFYNGTTWANYSMPNVDGTYEYGCYITNSYNFKVFKRDLSDDSITTQSYTLAAQVDNDDFHQQCSIGIDADEHIFVTGFSHSGAGQQTLIHYESSTPGDITSLTAVNSILGSTVWESGNITYPQYFRDESTDILYLTARIGGSGNGDQHLVKRNTGTNTWQVPAGAGTAGIIIEGTTGATTRSFYTLDIPVVKGDKIYMPGTLRKTTDPSGNHDVIVVVYDLTNDTVEAIDGTTGTAPIAWTTLETSPWLVANEGDSSTDVGLSSQGAVCAQDDGDLYLVYQAQGDLIVLPIESATVQTEVIIDTPTSTGTAWDAFRCFTQQSDETNMAVWYVNRTEIGRITHVFETSDNWDTTPTEYDIMERTNMQYSFIPWSPSMLYELGTISTMVQPTDVNAVWTTCTGTCGVTADDASTEFGGDGDNRVRIFEWAFGDQAAELDSAKYVGTFNGTSSFSDHGNVIGSEGASDLTVIALDYIPLTVTAEGIVSFWDNATAAQRNFTIQGWNTGALIVGVERTGSLARTCFTANSVLTQDVSADISLRWDGATNTDVDVGIDGSDVSCTIGGSGTSSSTLMSGVTENLVVGGYDEASGSLSNYSHMSIGDVFIFDEFFSYDKISLVNAGAIYTYNLQHWFKFDATTYTDQWGSADGTLTDVTISAQ